ncbi:hypothetical protein ACFPJ4_07220 [Lysinimonas soli]|uniref:J domain-containing protein n=1 Tax=Lysinimonas soli TaxID=1074233 RepID=A0ABW0NRU3_9MICO
MGVLSRLFGTEHGDIAHDRVLRRYRHVLGTAPIESLEQAHTEAFLDLREPQREAIYEELSRGAGTGERPLSSEPATLARSATRAERRVPGSLERTLRSADERGGFGGSLVVPVVDHVVGSPLVSAFLPWNG